MEKAEIAALRETIRVRQKGLCLWCAKPITLAQMHMHELIFRSHGGEMSLTNSVGLCYGCHFGNKHAHGKRKPQWRRKGNYILNFRKD